MSDPNFGKRRVLKFDEPITIDKNNIDSIVSIIDRRIDEHDFATIIVYSNGNKQLIVNYYRDLLDKTIDVIAIDLTKLS